MRDTAMQAIRFHDYGGPEQLVLETVPRPVPGEGQALVRVLASGVNGIDWKYRVGQLKAIRPLQLPSIPGVELAGLVEAVGAGVTSVRPGQAVMGPATGTYAEFAVAAADSLVPKPANIGFDEAASVPVGAQTAWLALFDLGDLRPGQRVLIHGAAGGVGSYAVQLARWAGAHVTGTSSGANLAFIRSIGVDTAVDYAATPFEEVAHAVDVVVDLIGGETQERSWRVLKPGGIVIAVGHPPDPARASQEGVRTATTIQGGPSPGRPSDQGLIATAQLIESGVVTPQLGRVFALADARQAQILSQTGHGRGRIVLHVADPP